MAGRGLRSLENAVPAHRRARESNLPGMPLKRKVCRPEHALQFVPSDELQQHDEPESHRSRISADVRSLSQHNSVDASQLRSQQNGVSANRRTCQRAVLELSRGRQIRRHADGLLRVPQNRLHECHQSKPRCGRVPDYVYDVSQHDELGRSGVQPHLVPDLLRCPSG